MQIRFLSLSLKGIAIQNQSWKFEGEYNKINLGNIGNFKS